MVGGIKTQPIRHLQAWISSRLPYSFESLFKQP